MLRDILVHVDDSPACRERLACAADLADAHGAHLIGLFARGQPILASREGGQRPPVDNAAERSARRFAELTSRHGLSGEWRHAEIKGPDDNVIHELLLHAHHADLVLVGQYDPDRSDGSVSPILPDKVVLSVGRPVIVVPYAGRCGGRFGRVLVAWNGARESVRAVNDAIPVLSRADYVQVLSVNPPDEERGDEIPSAEMCRHLARHGVRVEAKSLVAADLDVGDVLLSRVTDSGMDLLVMGAYGHSRLTELVMGGTTRHLLRHTTVPVLMSH